MTPTILLEAIWSDLAAKNFPPVYRRVDESHPIDFYAGLDAAGMRTLLLVVGYKPPLPDRKFRAFELQTHHRQDGRWAMNIHLRRPELARLFAHLCQDLVDAAREGCTPENAAAYVANRILRWESLLAKDRSGKLDESSLRGLLGELLYIAECALPSLGPRASVSAWYGPMDADQDFRFPDRLVEVKSAAVGSLSVMVSSAEQLDVHGALLFLSVVSLEEGRTELPGAFTVSGLVSRLRNACQNDGVTLALFEERLSLYGYTDRPEYEDRTFACHGVRHFEVQQGFPCIRRSELAAPIGNVRYTLDLSQCLQFERPTSL